MKKWIVGLATVMMAGVLAACSSSSSTVANMKGAKITKEEYYNEMKETSSGESTLRSMIVLKALEQQYGKKVSDKKVTKQYNTIKANYGTSFSSVLSQSGYTTKTFKEQIKTSLLSEVALKDLKKVTNANLKAQWKKYEPKVTVQYILVKKESTAKTVIAALAKDNTAANFKTLAKKYSTDTATKDSAGKLAAFDNSDTSLDSTFKKAAWKLKTGQYTTTPVKNSYDYNVIRMIKNPGKGTIKEHKAELTKQLYTSWQSSTTVMTKIIRQVLKKADVQIKDNDLKNVLSTYLGTSSSSSSSTK